MDAVCGVALAVKRGKIFDFLGPNCAGKTITLRMLTTLLPIDKGEAFVAGFDIKKQQWEVRNHIGFVSQPITLLAGVMLPLSIGLKWLQIIAHFNLMYYAIKASRVLAIGIIDNSKVLETFLVILHLTLLVM
ncbi:ATP-binding cassette domain-containing protein [Thermoanaerobacterium thermosaccharolyticum]|uniref:ATP-binding cassette domain-containing protein n=1 Tax=Thermoanaerobacterium thermosaccharolyticum TaxID=1517 RepID=UPI003DA7AD59